MRVHQPLLLTFVALSVILTTAAKADILNINDFWNNSTVNVALGDQSAAPALINGRIELTNSTNGESRTAFDNTPQPIGHFTASFTYTEIGSFSGVGTGITFVIQNVPAGPQAVGSFIPVHNPELGFAALGGVVNEVLPPESVAISLELTQATGTGLYQAGNVTAGSALATAPVNLLAGDPIAVSLSYDGHNLQELLTDTLTNATFSASYSINLPAVMQGSAAYIGFTGGSIGPDLTNDQQFISDFAYRAPEPSSWILAMLAVIEVLFARRHRSR